MSHDELIYGRYEVGQQYADMLPPAPAGLQISVQTGPDGILYSYIEEGTRPAKNSTRPFFRNPWLRATQTEARTADGKIDKSSVMNRISIDASLEPGQEVVVFNRNNLPVLINSASFTTAGSKAKKPAVITHTVDDMLVAIIVAARQQGIAVNRILANKLGIKYDGHAFGEQLPLSEADRTLMDSVIEYANPGGAGFNSRLAYYSNDSMTWNSKEGKDTIENLRTWCKITAPTLGFEAQTVLDQISQRIVTLEQANIPCVELVTFMHELMA